MEAYEVDSIVHGHHVFKEIWTPFIGEDLECKRDVSDTRDAYAVGIMRQEETGSTAIVGHVPQITSATCSLFLQKEGSIRCIITGNRQYSNDLSQGGSKYPVNSNFRSVQHLYKKYESSYWEAQKRSV